MRRFTVLSSGVAGMRLGALLAVGLCGLLACGDSGDESPDQGSATHDSTTQGDGSQTPPVLTDTSGNGAGASATDSTGGAGQSGASGSSSGANAGGTAMPGGGGMAADPSAGSGGSMPDAGMSASAGSGGDSTDDMGGSTADAGASNDPGGGGFGMVAVGDLSSDGAYGSTTEQNTGPGGNYTIYRPEQLAPAGALNPFVAWISGGGSSPSQYALLPHLASHGFVIIASNTVPQIGQQRALGQEMVAAVDWMLTEIERSGSEYSGKVDGTKVAAMGYSMGGLAATSAGGDSRWTTTVHISGGAGDGTISNLHAPALFVCGASGADIAGANCATDFDQATTPVFYGVFNGGDHLGVRTQPYADRIAAVITGWLRWQLMGDAVLESMFVGDACVVCQDSNWTVKQKNLQ